MKIPFTNHRAAIDPGMDLFRDDLTCSLAIENLEPASIRCSWREVTAAMFLTGGTVAGCAATYFAYLTAAQ